MRIRVIKGDYIETDVPSKQGGLRFILHTHGSIEDSTGGQVVRVEDIINKIDALSYHQGITIYGGEPMDQSDVLLSIVKKVRECSMDVWTYTNYQLEEVITIGAKFDTNSYQRLAVMSDMLACSKDNVNGCVIKDKQHFDINKTLLDMEVRLFDNF